MAKAPILYSPPGYPRPLIWALPIRNGCLTNLRPQFCPSRLPWFLIPLPSFVPLPLPPPTHILLCCLSPSLDSSNSGRGQISKNAWGLLPPLRIINRHWSLFLQGGNKGDLSPETPAICLQSWTIWDQSWGKVLSKQQGLLITEKNEKVKI
jgi:hypothetical protein